MTVSCEYLLRPAVWLTLVLAMLLWSSGAPATNHLAGAEKAGVSSDIEKQQVDIDALAKQFRESIGKDELPFTIMKVPKVDLAQGLVGVGEDVVVVNVPVKKVLAGKSKGEVIVGIQKFKAASEFANQLRKSGIDVIVAMDYADAWGPSKYKLTDQGPGCLLDATDWSQCFEQKVDYPEWYKGPLADNDPLYKSAAAKPPSFFELRGFPRKGLAHRYEGSYQ